MSPNGPYRNLLPDPVGVVSASGIIVGAALVVYGRAKPEATVKAEEVAKLFAAL